MHASNPSSTTAGTAQYNNGVSLGFNAANPNSYGFLQVGQQFQAQQQQQQQQKGSPSSTPLADGSNMLTQNQQMQTQQQASVQATSQAQTLPNDTTFTKIFVGGLPYHTTDETLKAFFLKFGNIEEAVVITDRQTGKSRGYGFVTMETPEAAQNAIRDPNPIIDGRKANVNLAYLGVKTRIAQPSKPTSFRHSKPRLKVNILLTLIKAPLSQ